MPDRTDGASFQSTATTVQDVFVFLRRRKWIWLGTSLPITLAAVCLAFWLPAVYLSEATILIEQSSLPDNAVALTPTGYVDEQIQVVSQRVFTPDRVAELIQKHDLYSSESGSTSVIAQFREDAPVAPISAEVADRRTGRTGFATVGFTVGFRAADPEVAQSVAADLAGLFLSENVAARMQRAGETTNFLDAEADRLAQEMSSIEDTIAQFKQQHGDALPDQALLNQQARDRVETELDQVRNTLIDLRARRDLLRSQLALTDPYASFRSEAGAAVLSGTARLDELRQQYAQLIARYGARHPDVIRTRREIDSLSSGSSGGTTSYLDSQIAQQEEQLALLRDRQYSDEHPDVRRVLLAIEALRAERSRAALSPIPQRPPDNPEYIQRQVELESVNEMLAATDGRRRTLEPRLDELRDRIDEAARIEQEWLLLNRDYESIQNEFREIKSRSTNARLSERLEESQQGDRFTLIGEANLPDQPIEPNRIAIIFLGIVLAMGAGLGMATLVDSTDATIRDARDVLTTVGVKPLASIPFIETHEEHRKRMLRRVAIVAAAAGGAGALFFALT